jgi:hypothetical protein
MAALVTAELDRRLLEATAVAAGPQEAIDALKLSRHGGVAALLVRDQPQWAMTAAAMPGLN